MRTTCAMLALMCCCASAAAHPGHDTAGRNLAATCANCHGTDGRSTASHIKTLAGADKALLLSKLRAFRNGSQSATIMHQIAAGYSDEQLELIAGYFSTRTP